MKKTLLLLTLCVSIFTGKVVAQEFPYTLNVFDEVTYYGMYGGLTDQPVPEGVKRNSNSSYGKKLTAAQLQSFGNTLTMNITLKAACDNYDRIGNANLVLVPKNAETYDYNAVTRIEIGRFITPFMHKNRMPNEVPYTFDVSNLTKIFHDQAILAVYDIWIELEVYGHQGTPGVDGAANEIPGCSARNDVYMGSLEFVSDNNPRLTQGPNFLLPLSYKYELKNYTLEGTDVLGQTTRTIDFSLDAPVENAKIYLITSNHGSNANGEEYNRRNHFVKFDNEPVLTYKPGGKSCEPYRVYNTQGNGIYSPSPRTLAAWLSFNNWCPGDAVPIRVIELGNLAAGAHSFNISVPDAVFADGQGYFPMSVYMQGGSEVLATSEFSLKDFSVYPNPVSNIATISTAKEVKQVTVYNTLGQSVLTATTKQVDFSSLNSGIYMMNIQFTDNKTVTQKIIKN